jgi:hypothetical protein
MGDFLKGLPDTCRHGRVGSALAFSGAFPIHICVGHGGEGRLGLDAKNNMQNGGALKCAPGRSQKFDVGAGSPVRTAEALRESRGCGVEPQVNPARRGPGRGKLNVVRCSPDQCDAGAFVIGLTPSIGA